MGAAVGAGRMGAGVNRSTSLRSCLVMGSRVSLCRRGRPWLMETGTALLRGRTRSRFAPMVASASALVRPLRRSAKLTRMWPVSYTHLTLPTILRV